VHLAGIQQAEELGAYYALARCFVLPSTSEPWGLVVNEAMSASLPVIVSSHCGCVEDLVEDGVNGFVFDPHDARALAALLEKASNSPALAAMGDHSQGRIQAFSPRRYAERLAAFLAQIHPQPN
jgi:glycosyltransferase involved in cell wall biosynthesis